MGKTLKEIVDVSGTPIKSLTSHGTLKIPYNVPPDTSNPPKKIETKQYVTCHCLLKSVQQCYDNLKAKLFGIIEHIPKII